MTNDFELEHGYLWPAVVERCKQARASGALCPLETRETVISDADVDFLIYRSLAPSNKPKNRDGDTNPFLDCEPDLFLGDITEHHYCLLNKYSVIDNHFLVVTRTFEHQESLLKLRDFHALGICLRELDALAIYNGGTVAGASQPHKHLQVVPLPLGEGDTPTPMDRKFEHMRGPGAHIRNPSNLNFQSAFAWLADGLFDNIRRASLVTYDLYVDLMESLGIRSARTEGTFWQPISYNLLLTRRWMMLVPRTREAAEGISINGFAFAGSIFVQGPEQYDTLTECGPMKLLESVARGRL